MKTECSKKQQVGERLACEHFLREKSLRFEMEMKIAIFPLYSSRRGGGHNGTAEQKKITLAEVIVQGAN